MSEKFTLPGIYPLSNLRADPDRPNPYNIALGFDHDDDEDEKTRIFPICLDPFDNNRKRI